MATKDKDNGIFSLVPSRVATFPPPSATTSTSTEAISSPDSFSDFFRLLCEYVGMAGREREGGRKGGREGGREGV